MKRFLGGVLAMALVAVPGGTAAQTVFVSAGAGIPVGDYGDYASVGWMAQGGVAFPIGTAGLSAGVGGLFGSNSHDIDGDKTNLYGGAAFVQYTIGNEEAASGYVFGGPGYLTHSYKSDTSPEGSGSGLALAGGGGVNFPLGGVDAYAEGMYLTGLGDEIDGTDVFVASLGVTFPIGG
jgi:hypothetical protein